MPSRMQNPMTDLFCAAEVFNKLNTWKDSMLYKLQIRLEYHESFDGKSYKAVTD